LKIISVGQEAALRSLWLRQQMKHWCKQHCAH